MHRRLAAARRGLPLGLRAARPRRLLVNGSGGTDVCTGHRLGLPGRAGLRGRDLGRVPRRRRQGLRRGRQRGGRRARRAGHHLADAVDAGRPVGRRATASATARPTSTATRASGARATGSSSPSAAAACSPAAPTRRSTAAGCGWAPASSTRWSRSSPRSPTALVVHLEDDEGGHGRAAAVRGALARGDGGRLGPGRRSRAALRSELSPRHVPDDIIVVVPAIPRTLTGKKLEPPVKRILRGEPAEKVASRDALADPAALDAFVALAAQRRTAQAPVKLSGRAEADGCGRERADGEPDADSRRDAASGDRTSAGGAVAARAGPMRPRGCARGPTSWPRPTSPSTSSPRCRTPAALPGRGHPARDRRPDARRLRRLPVPGPPRRRRDHRLDADGRPRERARLPVRLQGRGAGARGRPPARAQGRRRGAVGRPAADRDRDRRGRSTSARCSSRATACWRSARGWATSTRCRRCTAAPPRGCWCAS